MTAQLVFSAAVIPAIVGLTQVAKDLGLPSRFSPALAVALGTIAATAQAMAGRWTWVPAVFLGVALGLSACGLYSGAKTVASSGASNGAPAPAGRPHDRTESTP